MELEEAKRKYLNAIVRHKEKGYTYQIYYIYTLGHWSSDGIAVSFRMTCRVTIPMGYPQSASIPELERDYEIIP